MADIPLYWRLLILAAACLTFLLFDLVKPRGQRSRWREYLFLLGAGLGTGLLGVVVDCVTSTISPEYFLLGKGLSTTSWIEIAAFGLQAGFGPGIAAGALMLYANPEPQQALRLFRFLAAPLGLAFLVGSLAGLACHALPLFRHPGLEGALTDNRAAAFTRVWVIHLGVYAGGVAGLMWMIFRIRRAKAL